MALLNPRFALSISSFPPLQFSSTIPNSSLSETLILPRRFNRQSIEISISASVNQQQNSVLPIHLCCSSSTTSSSSSSDVESSDVDLVDKPPENRIFIKGLPKSTVDGFLAKTFSRFGKINRVKIITDRKFRESLGFAYIWFSSEEAAQLAVKEMDGKLFCGRFIYVTIAKPEAPTSHVRATPIKF